jgi:hypothetical protein
MTPFRHAPSPTGMNRHQLIETRSLRLHQAIAEKLRRNPDLIRRAYENIGRWKRINSFPQPYLDEWQAVLDQGLEASLALMCEDSERGRRLRQSSPFPGILSNAERWRILRETRAA